MTKKANNSEFSLQSPLLERKEKVPGIEWLFGQGTGAKCKKKSGFLRRLIKRDWKKIIYSAFLYILQSAPVWVLPLITSDVIDLVTTRPEGYVTRICIEGCILVVLLLQNIPSTMWRSRIVNRWIRTLSAELKSSVVRKLQRLSITYHKEVEEGRIQSKFLRDIMNVEMYYGAFINSFVMNVIGAIISIAIACVRGPLVLLFFVAVIPLNIALTMAFRKPVKREAYDFRSQNEKLSGKLTTTLQMLPLTKAHGLVELAEAQVNNNVYVVRESGLKLDRTHAKLGSMMWAMNQILAASSFFFCVFLAIRGYLSVGEVVLFQSLFASINGSISTLINFFPTFITGEEAAQSLSEILCAEDMERDDGKQTITHLQGKVTLENVSYHYPGEEKAVVKNLSLNVNAGERIAVVGSSGSGKSTLMNLLIGLLSPTEGRILVDDIPMQDIPSKEYRKFLSVVPQNSILFAGTLRENITYGLTSYTEEQLQRVIDEANVSEFLPTLSKGLDSIVGEHGDKLSGGQKQRICIARALIRNPKILILDEATSALDNVSEYHVQQAIDKLVEKRTTFIVAHRLSTIRNADRIVVMENGEMVEMGTYEELMAKNGKFSELERLSKIREEKLKNTAL